MGLSVFLKNPTTWHRSCKWSCGRRRFYLPRSDTKMSTNDRIISISPVQTRRLARQWSQAELAERAGISRAAVSAIEGERLSPSVATALVLAAVFECSVEELFGRGEPLRVNKLIRAITGKP